MKSSTKYIVYGVLALVALLVVVKVFKVVHPAWTRSRLKSAVNKIEPWTSSTTYSDAGWKQIVKSARAFQKVDHQLAQEALTDYLKKYERDPNQLVVEQGKTYLLLRVIFEVPERGGGQIPFGQWERGRSDVNPDGSFNQAWPLVWNGGKPQLVAGLQGTAGPTYSVAGEYDYFRYNFKPRDLSKVSW